MVAKTEDLANELRKKIAVNKIILGAKETKKNLLSGKIKKVILASNCTDETREDFEKTCKLTNTELQETENTNEELGIICKKQYSVSVLGVLK